MMRFDLTILSVVLLNCELTLGNEELYMAQVYR